MSVQGCGPLAVVTVRLPALHLQLATADALSAVQLATCSAPRAQPGLEGAPPAWPEGPPCCTETEAAALCKHTRARAPSPACPRTALLRAESLWRDGDVAGAAEALDALGGEGSRLGSWSAPVAAARAFVSRLQARPAPPARPPPGQRP